MASQPNMKIINQAGKWKETCSTLKVDDEGYSYRTATKYII